jgi:hypothetical protein
MLINIVAGLVAIPLLFAAGAGALAVLRAQQARM